MLSLSLIAQWNNAQIARVPADTIPKPTVASCSPSSTSHLGGATITVTGSGFITSWGEATVQSVYCGTTQVAPTVVSATSLTFVAPAHAAGPVAIVVNTSGGCASKPSGVTFT